MIFVDRISTNGQEVTRSGYSELSFAFQASNGSTKVHLAGFLIE